MAKYNYQSVEFCKRVKIRKSIKSKNMEISRIARSLNYGYNSMHTLVMDAFNRDEEAIIEKYLYDVSPIDFFSADALEEFSVYLDNILKRWPNAKRETIEYNKKALETLVKEEGKLARERCRAKGFLPESNSHSVKLPNNISGAMVLKADETLKKAEIQTSSSAYNVIERPYAKKAQNKNQKPATKQDIENLTAEIKKIQDTTVKPTENAQDKKEKNKQKPETPEIVKQSMEVNLFNYDELAKEKPKKAKTLKELSEPELKHKRIEILKEIKVLKEQVQRLHEKVIIEEDLLTDFIYEDKIERNPLTYSAKVIKTHKQNIASFEAQKEEKMKEVKKLTRQLKNVENLLDTSLEKYV